MRLTFLLAVVLGCFSGLAAPFTTTNLLRNPGGEANNLDDWVIGGDSSPELDYGAFDPGINPHSGTNDFLGGSGDMGSLSQIVPLIGNQGIVSAVIDAGSLQAYVSFWEQGVNQAEPNDDGFVSLVFMGATSNSISAWSSPEIDSHFQSWSNYSAYLPSPAGTRFIQYNMNFVRHEGDDLDTFFDDNVLSVVSAIPAPVLNISASSTGVLVCWPTLYSDGFLLLQNTNPTSTNWTTVDNPVTTLNGTNRISIAPSSEGRFFQLYHP